MLKYANMRKKFSWKKIGKPIIALAPMAGITDSPFRRICKSFGAEVVFSEMVSSVGLSRRDKKSFQFCKFKKSERPYIVQIFGKDPAAMAEAAKIVQDEIKADGVDINMGCPARKVISSFHGAALMRDQKLAEKIVKAVRKTITIPLSVKTRLGWSNKKDILTFCRMLECSGIDLLTIHARTKVQGFSGKPNYIAAQKAKESLRIPVIINGGIMSLKDAALVLKDHHFDGVMIARGALGNPFIFENLKIIKHDPKRYLQKKGFLMEEEIGRKERFETAVSQAELAHAEKGERGILEMRKHLGWYVRGLPDAKRLRQKLVMVKSVKQIRKILSA